LGTALVTAGLVVAALALAMQVGHALSRPERASAAIRACAWKSLQVPDIPGLSLNAVFASSPDDVWMVGSRGDALRAQTLALHFDGQSLRVAPTPNPAAKSNLLHDVVAFAADDVWAVGEGVSRKNPVFHYVPLVLHFDGVQWQRVSPAGTFDRPFGATLNGIDGVAADDVWAVGTADRPQGTEVGLIEHWNGEEWRVVSSPLGPYYAVAALSESDVWAVGGRFSTSPNPNRLTAHWNGKTWITVKDTALPDRDTNGNGVSASGPRNVWIVGQEAAAPFVERFNGRSWVRVKVVPYAHWQANYENQYDGYFEGVAVIAPTDVWAVGTFGIEHYDGRRWTLISRNKSFLAISAATPTDLWAVGGNTVWRHTCA
jgi:hypothetical protein